MIMRKYLTILTVSVFAVAIPSLAQERRSDVGVGAAGGPVIDPTKNVLDLVDSAIRRQDDLRAALLKQIQTQFDLTDKLNDLRDRRTQELAAALANKLNAEAQLRAEYEQRLALAEAKRIDAIRAVDVNAVAVANQRTSEQATALQTQTQASAEVLRNQVARSAEDLRALVATTAATALANQQQQFTALSARITTLEQAGASAAGTAKYQDPAIADLIRRVELLAQRQTTVTGQGEGSATVIAYVIAIVMFLVALGGLVISELLKKNSPWKAR